MKKAFLEQCWEWARLADNPNLWTQPSKEEKLDTEYKRTHGFGHEDWLFEDSPDLIDKDGFHKGFLQGFRDKRNQPRNILLYQNTGNKQWEIVGYILEAEYDESKPTKIDTIIKRRKKYLKKIGVDNYENPNRYDFAFNIKFKSENAFILKKSIPIEDYHRICGYKHLSGTCDEALPTQNSLINKKGARQLIIKKVLMYQFRVSNLRKLSENNVIQSIEKINEYSKKYSEIFHRKVSSNQIHSGVRISETKYRIGQAQLRKFLLEERGCCDLTGFDIKPLLVVSHIIPWCVDEQYRTDPRNVLLLRFDIDALFDAGFISFEDDGKMIIAKSLDDALKSHPNDTALMGLKEVLAKKPKLDVKRLGCNKFLAYHREYCFQDGRSYNK